MDAAPIAPPPIGRYRAPGEPFSMRQNVPHARAQPPAPQVERLVSFVSGGRYVFFSVAATAVALAATYQSALRPPAVAIAAEGDPEVTMEAADAAVVVDAVGETMWTRFVKELLGSRLSSTIVLHFYFVVLYHVFLGVTRACFGAIRRPEIQQTKETILHFLLMRSLLLASTIGAAQTKPPVELLLIWLSVVAFLRGIISICNARFDFLLTRPMTRAAEFHRLAITLLATMVANVAVAGIATFAGVFSSTVVHLTWFEASLFLIKASQLGTKVVFHVFDLGNVAENGLEKGELYLLLLQTTLSGAHLVQLVVYYLYIISVDHFRVSFLDFILILNVKTATVELLEKVKQVQVYQQVVIELDSLFPDATPDELAAVHDDVCVICLKPMDTHAKKLQCGHLFHRLCLRQCLQRASVGDSFATLDPGARAAGAPARGGTPPATPAAAANGQPGSRTGVAHFRCPLCRKSVSAAKERPSVGQASIIDQNRAEADGRRDGEQAIPADTTQPPTAPAPTEAQPPPAQDPARENVLRISTEFLSRWIPFVPNLSFEIVRPPSAAPLVINDEMVHRVLDVFPQFSPETIRQDLARTRSPERTIERILSGRLQEQPTAMDGDVINDGVRPNLADDDLQWDLSLLWDALWGAPRAPAARPPGPLARRHPPPPGNPFHGQAHEQGANRFL